MRVLFPIFFSLILINCSDNREFLTDLDKIGLKGDVKYLKFRNQETIESEDQGINIDNEFFFNRNGMISEQRQYTSNELSQIFVFKYDEHFRLISKEYFNASRELLTKSKFKNILNDRGKLIEQLEYRIMENSISNSSEVLYHDLPYLKMQYAYNQNGQLARLTYVQSVFGDSFPKTIVEYKDGRVDKELLVDSNGSKIRSSEVKCLEFDKKGNCLKLKTIDDNRKEEYTNAEIEYYK